LEKTVNGEMGLLFVMLVLSPFLKSGFTIEILRQAGKTPLYND
jgi:hypothetical protein